MAGRGLLLARLGALLAALVGATLVVVGATLGGSGGGETVAGSTRLDGVVAVITAPGVLGQGPERVRLRATATTARTSVFIGVARADDATAWAGDLARVEVLAEGEQGALDIARTDGPTTAPNPQRADIWVASAVAQGFAQLDWTPAAGQWRAVLVAGTAAGGFERVEVSWTRPAGRSTAPALIALGLVLLVAGGVVALVLRRRSGSGPGGGAGFDDDLDDDLDAGEGPDPGRGAGGPDGPTPRWQDPEATTRIPRVHGRRKAGSPPWSRVLPVVLTGLVLAGCSGGSAGAGSSAAGAAAAGPSGSGASATGATGQGTAGAGAGAEPGYPALLVPQADTVLDKVDAALSIAVGSGSVDETDGRVLGPYARRLAADRVVAAARSAGASPSASASASVSASPSPSASADRTASGSSSGSTSVAPTAALSRDRLLLTRHGGWPRFFMVAGAAPGRPTPVLRVYLSPSVRDPYGLWAEPVLLPGATLPEVASADRGAQTLTANATGLAASPQQVAAGYADVLTRSTASGSAALFAPDEFRRQVSSRVAADQRDVKAIGTVTSRHTVLPEGVLALRTADGGAVVVAALQQTYTVTVKKGAGTVRVDDRLATLGGRRSYSSSLERTSVEVVVLTVPPAGGGLVRVVAAAKDDVAVKGS